jgi:branched-chain amino acid transport system ATP-binding protein
MTPMLELDDLQSGYGETRVLQGVNATVDEGEVVALVGRNGVGKTTTLRSVLGSVEPWAGTVRYRGEDVTDLGDVETVRRGIGLVPEERRIFPGLTVTENLELASYGGADTENRRDLEWVFDTFENLDERRENRGSDLSGGEQQMLAIARALVSGADLLMLDEPTEGLAPLIVDRVMEVVKDVRDAGITVLLVEQNVRVALDLADRVYVLAHGEIVHEATPEELRADEETVQRYLGVSFAD